jgi:hypothetical protein
LYYCTRNAETVRAAYEVVIVLQRHVVVTSSATGHLANVSRYLPREHQEERGHMYNQAGVDALDAVRAVVALFGAPIAFRKLYGILNAMEMHVEETPYSVEALQHLGKALEATARLYRIEQQKSTQLARALATFFRTVEKQ